MPDFSSLLDETHKTFPKRMSVLADFVGSIYKIGVKTGLSQSGIRSYFDGSEPSRPVLIALAEVGGVNIEWLVTGKGDMRSTPLGTRTAVVETFLRYCRSHEIENSPHCYVEFVKSYNDGVTARAAELEKLSVYELKNWHQEYLMPSASSGEFVTVPWYDLDTVDSDSFTLEVQTAARNAALLCFRRELLVGTWKLDAEKLCMFTVRSEEMSPLLRPGDWVLVDCKKHDKRRNGIYVVSRDEDMLIRRATFVDTRVRLVQENVQRGVGSEEGMEELEMEDVIFFGRVVCFIRRVRT